MYISSDVIISLLHTCMYIFGKVTERINGIAHKKKQTSRKQKKQVNIF